MAGVRTRSGDAREAALDRYRCWTSLPEMTLEVAAERGDQPFLWAKRDGEWISTGYSEAAETIRALARGLIELGVESGDRVALVAENRPEWAIAEVAIMAAGGVAVPCYTTNLVEDHEHVFKDSGAKHAIVSTAPLAERVLAAAARTSALRTVVAIEPIAPESVSGAQDVTVVPWGGAVDRGRNSGADLATLRREDLACLIYTSGTGGRPKGVMLSHGAILANCLSAFALLWDIGIGDEVFLSFLPLSHAYEHTAGQFFPISIGAQICYAEGVEALARNMVEVRPTIMTAVPRLYETMHGRILGGLRRAPAWRRRLFFATVGLGRRRYERGGRLPLHEALVDRLLDRLVRAQVTARFGGRIKAMVSGGAPLNTEIGLFFLALGVRLLQGYGQTEASPVISCNPPHRIRIDTVGPPLEGVEVRIADDGELLARGEMVMQGYWNQPEATAEALRDGWLHTGDVGAIEDDGYIRITDRKKDIIVLSGGDTLSPQRVEGYLTLEPEIHQAMVVGDGKPYLVGLIVPDAEAAAIWARSLGKPTDLPNLIRDAEFRGWIADAVDRVNEKLPPVERVRRHALIPEPFGVENGMLTQTMKIRRHVIHERYRTLLGDL